MKNFKEKWLKFVGELNSRGIPLPLCRDPKTGRGDVALTLVVISSIWLQIGLVGKWSSYLDGINMNEAMEFFAMSCSLYWARKLGANGDGKIELGDVDKPKDKKDDLT